MADDPATSAAPASSTASSLPADLAREERPGEGPGEDYASRTQIRVLGSYLLVMFFALLYLLVALWPQPTPSMSHSDADRIVAQRSQARGQPQPRSAPVPPDTNQKTAAAGTQSAPQGGAANPPDTTTTSPATDTRSQAATLEDSIRAQLRERHARIVMPGPGVRGVPGFYRCVPPDSTRVWVVHEDDTLDPQCVRFILVGSIPISNEVRMLLVVLLSGALGALLYTLRSLRWYVGTRWLKQSWLPHYYLFPFIGALLALITYAVLRGPFFNSSTDIADTSPISFAAAGFLVGLFNEEAIEKLREIAKSVFAPKNAGPETAPGVRTGDTASSTSTDTQAPVEEGDAAGDDDVPAAPADGLGISGIALTTPDGNGAPTAIEVRGSGFTATTQLEVDGTARQPQFESASLLKLQLSDEERAKLAGMGTLNVVAFEPGQGGARSQPVHVP